MRRVKASRNVNFTALRDCVVYRNLFKGLVECSCDYNGRNVLSRASTVLKGCFSRRENCEGDCDGLRMVVLCCWSEGLVVRFARNSVPKCGHVGCGENG
jgi:hypothetical protein